MFEEQFLERAKELWHPYDTMILLPDEIVRALFEVLTKEPLDTCKWRLQCIQQWQRWATECESAEKDLKLRMHKDVRSIVAHLRISLMKKVGAQIGWTDATLCDQLADGFRLVGDAAFLGVFKEDFKPASLNEDELFARTRLLKPLIMERLMCDGRSEFTAALSDLCKKDGLKDRLRFLILRSALVASGFWSRGSMSYSRERSDPSMTSANVR